MRRWKTGHFASWSEASCCYLLRLVQENHTPQGTGIGLAREWSAGGALVNENPLRRPDGTSAQEWSYHGRCRNAITDARTPWRNTVGAPRATPLGRKRSRSASLAQGMRSTPTDSSENVEAVSGMLRSKLLPATRQLHHSCSSRMKNLA